mmetsp:Transcript_2412/g.3523  ORF Transcript_2412/g.3523 Transcript_2412/m.3523 type:complete len:330 (-) Transcript_2412:308-1297(-)
MRLAPVRRIVRWNTLSFGKRSRFLNSLSKTGERQPVTETILSSTSSETQIADAIRPGFTLQNPVVVRSSSLSICDAVKSWSSLDYLTLSVGDNTMCEVEIGAGYNDTDGMRPEIPFGAYIEYLDQFRSSKNSNLQENQNLDLVYLAQNDLNHFPALLDDISIPQLCSDSSLKVGEGKLYNNMLWLGPTGTVSPLHYDPLDNLLMQIVGEKRVILYPRTVEDVLFFPKPLVHAQQVEEKEIENEEKNRNASSINWHYAGSDGNQYNTSPINVEDPDYEKYPHFAQSPTPYECTIGPGDILYIPKKWWHHVRALETVEDDGFCLSVNAWWR